MKFSEKNHIVPVAALLVALLLTGCATPPKSDSGSPGPVWPPAPAAARIQYLTSISNAEDIGISKSFWARLLEFISGPDENRLVRPMAIAADSNNNVYVADPGARGVHRYDLANNAYTLLTRKNNAALVSPVGLAIGPDNRVFICDSGLGQVFTAGPGDKHVYPLELDANLKQPTDVAYDAERNRLYVVDASEHSIKVLTPSGRLIKQFGNRGDAPGQFNFPTAIWLDNKGRLLITDSLNYRIQVLDPDGQPLARFGQAGDASGKLARPKGVATDRDGHVYVVDSMFHAFQVFNQDGELLLHLGEQGHAAGQFWLPTGIFITPDDKIYVADAYNQRVQVFRYIGSEP